MKYFIIAGERSGDLHGSNLIKGIRTHDPAAEIMAWGGDLMQNEGATLLKHYRDLAFMGFVEVLVNLPKIIEFLKTCKRQIVDYQPDVVILIDYAGFNMRIARFAKTQGFRTFYYISPKVWAWNQGRAWNIKKYVDKMFVIFPFEVDFFRKYDYEAIYVGNPLLDAIEAFKNTQTKQVRNTQLIALLPGSRKQEVLKVLPVMLETTKQFPDYTFAVAKVSNLPEEFYEQILVHYPHVKTMTDDTYSLLTQASAALVTSGTATLETALFGVPQVVCYATNALSALIGRWVIRVPYISLVNLILGKEAVKELIQNDLTTDTLGQELRKIVANPEHRTQVLQDYATLQTLVGQSGASERAGRLMVQELQG